MCYASLLILRMLIVSLKKILICSNIFLCTNSADQSILSEHVELFSTPCLYQIKSLSFFGQVFVMLVALS